MNKKHLFVKTVIDYFLALLLLIPAFPVLILVIVLIKITSKGPSIYKQERIGKNGDQFILYKFRTMVDNAENIGDRIFCGENDPRITRIGRILRQTGLDELPQLINIIKGEMSFIGPRPTLAYQVMKYNNFQRKRLLVKPGITGWAQVNGRNQIPWSKRIELDVWYIENYHLFLDLKILFLTLFSKKSKKIYGNKDIFDL